MRIAASNPDGIGDLVLRQPLYAALQAAGHELLLLVRPHSAALPEVIAPGCQFALIPGAPYDAEMLSATTALDQIAARIAAFAPDVFLVAPYQWTLFEERIVPRLPTSTRVVGMTGHVFAGDLRGGADWRSSIQFASQAEVGEDDPELLKNARLAAHVLGSTAPLAAPQIAPTADHATLAGEVLRRSGLQSGEFIVACVGDHQFSALRNWTREKWAAVLAHWVRRYQRRIVFVGVESERTTVDAIRERMGDAATSTVSLLDKEHSLATLIGITAAARAYIGKDTGPMHIAAALGLPVIAVFGGGHWPRFVPAPRSGLVATVGVPCVGCDWVCPFEQSYCIKTVPEVEIIEAIDALEVGAARAMQLRVLPLDPALHATMDRRLRKELHAAQRRMYRAERDAEAHRSLQGEFGPQPAERMRATLAQTAAQSREIETLRSALDNVQSREIQLRAALCEAREAAISAAAARQDVEIELRETRAARDTLAHGLSVQLTQSEALAAEVKRRDQLVARYRQYVADLRKSRWRQLGLRIGTARRAAWEHGEEGV